MKLPSYSRLPLIAILFLSAFTGLSAQNKRVEISGRILAGSSGQPVEYATVILADSATQTAVAGTTTSEDGRFELAGEVKDFYLEIRFIGFETKTITGIEPERGKADLGDIQLEETGTELEEVEIRAEQSQTTFKLDKRVFNVGQDLSSTGASALELLNEVPSVSVNIEGEISLRGSKGVQVLINGKPSVLANEEGNALGTITADMIESIEVITNPSAKYQAEGTSGIINIIIKKDERKGINGSVSLNTGWPHNHSLGLSLNRRTEKFNLFSQLGAGYRSLPRYNDDINRNLATDTTILSEGTEYRNETFFNVILGTDYHINRRNVITLSGNFAYEIEDQPSETDFVLQDGNGIPSATWTRTENTSALNPKYQYELVYKKTFPGNEDHTLLFSALGNLFQKTQSSDFQNLTTGGNLPDSYQRTATDFGETMYTFQLDYAHPFSEKIKLETGGQYVMNDVSNDYSVSNLTGSEWIEDPGLTNVFEYEQKVLGAYATGAYEKDRWGVKAGLRLENTDLTTLLTNTGEDNHQNYTNLFPSLHTSFKLSDRFSIQAGYSRRIFRPRLWDLNPFFNIRNNFSIRTGNPELLPEFTDSYELNGIYILDKISLNLGVFHRYTTDVVERVSFFENNVNTTKPLNIGENRSTGVEFNFKYSPGKRLSFNGDFNYQFFIRNGEFEGTSFDFEASRWSTRLTAKLKLPADIDLELNGNYESRYQTVQSIVSGFAFADFGMRKKLLKGKGVINLSVRDIFASRIQESEITRQDFYLYSFSQRGRFLTLGFSYGIGKGEAMEYSGGRRR